MERGRPRPPAPGCQGRLRLLGTQGLGRGQPAWHGPGESIPVALVPMGEGKAQLHDSPCSPTWGLARASPPPRPRLPHFPRNSASPGRSWAPIPAPFRGFSQAAAPPPLPRTVLTCPRCPAPAPQPIINQLRGWGGIVEAAGGGTSKRETWAVWVVPHEGQRCLGLCSSN